MKNMKIIVGTLGLLGGIILLVQMRNTLVERGLYADATGASGYTTNVEIALILLGLAMLIGSAFVLVRALAIDKK